MVLQRNTDWPAWLKVKEQRFSICLRCMCYYQAIRECRIEYSAGGEEYVCPSCKDLIETSIELRHMKNSYREWWEEI